MSAPTGQKSAQGKLRILQPTLGFLCALKFIADEVKSYAGSKEK